MYLLGLYLFRLVYSYSTHIVMKSLHQNSIFIRLISKLQQDICLVECVPLTKQLIEKYTNKNTAFYVNAIEVIEFDRISSLGWITGPLFGRYRAIEISTD